MPIWAPPTPPTNENDIYIDYSVAFWYEPSLMHEARLPPVFIKKEAKRQKIDPVVSAVATTRKQKVRKDDMVNIPRSLFDRPSAAILKMRREVKLQKVKGLMVGTSNLAKPLTSFPGLKQSPIVVNKPALEIHNDKLDWLVQEDWSVLQIIQDIQSIPLNLTVLLPGHIPNWDMACEAVHSVCQNYKSSKSCRLRYENIVVPREEGKILYDTNPKKQKKTKGIYKTKNNRPMKTSQLYIQDNNGTFSKTVHKRFKLLAESAVKRKPIERPSFLQAPKNPKPPDSQNINYDVPLSPKKVACNRAERLARDKQKNVSTPILASQVVQTPAQVQSTVQAIEQQIAVQRQVSQQTTVTVAPNTNIIPHQTQTVIANLTQAQQLQQVQLTKTNIQQGNVTSVSLAKSLTSGIMVNAAAGSTTANTLATITKALGQAGVSSLTSQSAAQNAAIAAALSNANLRNQRASVTAAGSTTTISVQEMVAAATARALTTAAGTTSTAPAVVSVANLAAVQLAASQRLTGTTLSPATTIASVGQINHQVAATQRNIAQLSQIQTLRQNAYIRQREQNLKQQQYKRLQTVQQQQVSQPATKVAIGGTLTVAATPQQRIAQQVTMKQSVGRTMTDAEMAQLVKRQQLQQQKQAQLATAQILAQAQLQQVQPQQVSITGGSATLVKTVSAPLSGGSSLAIPVSAVAMGGVNINVSLPQGKSGTIQTKGAANVTGPQFRQFHVQQVVPGRKGNKLTANLTQLAKVQGKGTAIPASSLSASMNAVQIVQHNPQVGTTQQVKGLAASMTVQQIQQAMKQAIPQNLPVVVTATPSLPGIQQQHTPGNLRGEPGVAGSVKAQTTTLPSTTLTTSGVLKGTPAVVVGQQQTAAILQQVAASSSGITPQAVTLAVRTAAQVPGQQVQIQVQQSPHSSLVTPQSQVVSATLQTSQARMQQLSQSASVNIAQPIAVQNTGQASNILTSSGTLVQQVPADSTLQSSTHVVMHNVVSSSSTPVLSIPATLTTPVTTQNPVQVVQAAIQAAKQQQQQAAQKASPYTMRLRNLPK